jgi:hypothetical protein
LIERLLEAERALAVGLVDQAERLYASAAEADPRNAIAVVGLAKIALERGDDDRAFELGQRALAIDPENVAARRLVDRLNEVRVHRGLGAWVAPSADIASGGLATPADRRPIVGRLRRWLRRG